MSSGYEWQRCTVEQWEKKVELSLQNGQMASAIKYADLANCRQMYDEGMEAKIIQNRFGDFE